MVRAQSKTIRAGRGHAGCCSLRVLTLMLRRVSSRDDNTMREAWTEVPEKAEPKSHFPRIKSALAFLSNRNSGGGGGATECQTSPNRNPVSVALPTGPAHTRQSATLAGLETGLASSNSAPQLASAGRRRPSRERLKLSHAQSSMGIGTQGVNQLPNAPPLQVNVPHSEGMGTAPGRPAQVSRTPTPPSTPPRDQARSPSRPNLSRARRTTATDPAGPPPFCSHVTQPISTAFREGLLAAIAAPLQRNVQAQVQPQRGGGTPRGGPDSQPVSPVTTPQGDDFDLETFGSAAAKPTRRNVLLDKERTTIILDWDDTLLPTSHISAYLNKISQQQQQQQQQDEEEGEEEEGKEEVATGAAEQEQYASSSPDTTEDRMKKALHLFEDTVLEFLDACLRCAGTIIIVTNGTNQWIEMSCRYIPRVAALLSSNNIEYVSSRTCSRSPDPSRWKVDTFRRLVDTKCGNLLSIGDAFFERSAAHCCGHTLAVPALLDEQILDLGPPAAVPGPEVPGAAVAAVAESGAAATDGGAITRRRRRIKTIKMVDRPSILQMRRQLSTMAKNLEQLVEIDADFDADLELPVIESGGWDARVVPAREEDEEDPVAAATPTAKGEGLGIHTPKPAFVPQTYQQMR